ncbi:MAG: NADH-quinone oxidoreductase subunit NuoN [Roseateles sp.]|jgi:NADH-quinone oxidoreductase subunit N|nr:NADH-quinone oxidoreductase subunit NuoN [Methylibium sp.]MBY0366677.1 NADH-quinone oxidoreductase subunit NuoN [Burkholderiaceae bacterium]|mmetsp:Transcript_15026/g.35418  ORF Transcript_15026/g.35418 Transcript_15026/m.35418 type:complete len:494 (+) Transcript_15026:4094-5575(+)
MNDMNWLAIYPEILLLVMGCVVALVDLWVTDEQRRPTYWLTQLTLVVVAGLHFSYFDAGLTSYAMQNMVVADPMGHLLAGFACVATLITLVYARPYAGVREMLKGELFILSLFALLGINVMLSANNFLVIYLGLELMSLSLYALVALRRDNGVATEAAMKYFVLGALASGFLLYGLSMMYGATGSLSIPQVFDVISQGIPKRDVLVFGVVFVVAGLAFKLGAAPFHMWVPDVYQGAPTAVTLLIGAAPKLAAFAITVRLLVEGMIGLAVDWQQMLVVLAVMSLLIGNLAAIAQTNLKRMLAYSTIANMGFMLLGMTAGVVHGNTQSAANAYSSAMFYTVTYVLTTLGTFGMVILLSRQGHEAEEIKDLAGLGKRSPWFALVMTLFMFSLAGVPPTVGFHAKLAVLQALVTTNVPFYVGLAVFAVVVSLVGAFYYLRVVKVMFFDEPTDAFAIAAPADVRVLMSLNGAAVLVFGLLPGGLLDLCKIAIRQALTT